MNAGRICLITTVHPAFDIRIFHKEAVSLAKAGYEVTLIASDGGSGIRDGVRLVSMPKAGNRFARMTLGASRAFFSSLKTKAQVVHFQDPELIPVGLALRMAGIKVIYDVHEDVPKAISSKHYIPRWIRAALSFFMLLLEKMASPFFSAIIAATPAIAERFRFHHRMVIVCNYPLSGEIHESTVNSRSDSMICAGVISENRGALVMLEAIRKLNERRKTTLILAGKFSPDSLRPAMERHPGWKHVEYAGFLDRPELAGALMRSSAGLVILDPEERFRVALPTKMFEYMAAGIPVIASDFPLWRRIITEAGCGILVDPANPDAIADAMETVLSNPMEALEMGKRGREAFLSRYNWTTQEGILLELYRDLFARVNM